MVMSIGYSCILYSVSIGELERQMPPTKLLDRFDDGTDDAVTRFFSERLGETRNHYLLNLLALNVLTLIGGAGLSYILARKTLQPIERAMESQSRFTLDASHELRTPLTAIQVENEVALRSKALTLPRARRLLESNVEEVAKLRGLADGLLRLARDEPIKRENVLLSEALDEAMHRITSQASEKKVTLQREADDLTVNAELTSLTQVLVILLDNAIKYSGTDTTVTIGAVRHGATVAISISDQGPGIEPDELEHIFDRFYRADQSRSRQHVEGYGLGLSIAHKLITQLGGTISAKSEPGKGATFVVRLPHGKTIRKPSA